MLEREALRRKKIFVSFSFDFNKLIVFHHISSPSWPILCGSIATSVSSLLSPHRFCLALLSFLFLLCFLHFNFIHCFLLFSPHRFCLALPSFLFLLCFLHFDFYYSFIDNSLKLHALLYHSSFLSVRLIPYIYIYIYIYIVT